MGKEMKKMSTTKMMIPNDNCFKLQQQQKAYDKAKKAIKKKSKTRKNE